MRTTLFRTTCCALGLLCALLGRATGKEPEAADDALAARRLIEQALTVAPGGQDRADLLAQAAVLAPEEPLVRALLREVPWDGRWQPLDDVEHAAAASAERTEYLRLRDTVSGEPADIRRLARWCRDHALPREARAHFWQLLQQLPDDREARRELGFIRVSGLWVLQSEWEAVQTTAQQERELFRVWRREIADRETRLESEDPARRDAAWEELARDWDTAATAVCEQLIVAELDAASQVQLVQLLSARADTPATESIVRLAIGGVDDAALAAEAELLRRPATIVVPCLVDQLLPATTTELVLDSGPLGGRTQQVFVQELPDRYRVFIQDVAVVRAPSLWHRTPDLGELLEELSQREEAADAWNLYAKDWNRRTMQLLRQVTGMNPGDAPQDWWAWQAEEQGLGDPALKPVEWAYVGRTVQPMPVRTLDESLLPVATSAGAHTRVSLRQSLLAQHSCFAPDTQVWTMAGRRPISEVVPGDLVLAQDADTGQLDFAPVLEVLRNSPEAMLRVQAGNAELLATPNHLLWVVGAGWRRADALQIGQALYTLDGPLVVTGVEPAGEHVPCNLLVEGAHSMFVDECAVLAHDISRAARTAAVAPGLPGMSGDFADSR